MQIANDKQFENDWMKINDGWRTSRSYDLDHLQTSSDSIHFQTSRAIPLPAVESCVEFFKFKNQSSIIMILNEIIFGIMMIEVVFCLVLVLPFGSQIVQSVVNWTSATFGKNQVLLMVLNIILSLILLLFLSNCHTAYTYQQSSATLTDGLRIRLLMAQRDLYISGFSLFLFLLLGQMYVKIAQNLQLDKSLGALKKQAEGASASFTHILEEKDVLEKQLTRLLESIAPEEEESEKQNSPLFKLLAENTKLEAQVKQAEGRVTQVEKQLGLIQCQAKAQNNTYMKLVEENEALEKKSVDATTLSSQAANQAKAYASLMEEHEALKNQIADYDFMFGEKKKKEL